MLRLVIGDACFSFELGRPHWHLVRGVYWHLWGEDKIKSSSIGLERSVFPSVNFSFNLSKVVKKPAELSHLITILKKIKHYNII